MNSGQNFASRPKTHPSTVKRGWRSANTGAVSDLGMGQGGNQELKKWPPLRPCAHKWLSTTGLLTTSHRFVFVRRHILYFLHGRIRKYPTMPATVSHKLREKFCKINSRNRQTDGPISQQWCPLADKKPGFLFVVQHGFQWKKPDTIVVINLSNSLRFMFLPKGSFPGQIRNKKKAGLSWISETRAPVCLSRNNDGDAGTEISFHVGT